MEIMRGKQTVFLDAAAFNKRRAGYTTLHMDIGTGDGRFVRHIAAKQPEAFVVGIDACRENLQESSRSALPNTLFVIANASALPHELYGLADSITINFPWGSLLEGLVNDDAALLSGLRAIARPCCALDVRINSGALAEAGWALDAGAAQVRRVLLANGFSMGTPTAMNARDLKAYPTSWAKRLAYGRDPHAVVLLGKMTD